MDANFRDKQIELIKKAIEIAGSMRELALKMNRSYQAVADWKLGKKSPNYESAKMLEIATEGKIKAKEFFPNQPWD